MSFRNIKALMKSEIGSYMVSPAAYVFVIIFLLLSGSFTFLLGGFFQSGQATLSVFFMWHPWLYLFMVPAAGMHLWSEERRSGTLELLFTMPVTPFECIIAKFFAAWAFIAVGLFCTFPVVLTVSYLGNPDFGAIMTGYLGSILMAGSYLAITGFTSAITRSQVVSFIISVVVCLLLIFIGWPPITNTLVDWAPRGLIDFFASLSVMSHFESIQRGVIDSRDLLYYFSVIGFFLFLTSITLKNHRSG